MMANKIDEEKRKKEQNEYNNLKSSYKSQNELI